MFPHDPTESAAALTCENCGHTADELIDLPGRNFKACPVCAEDRAREDAREWGEVEEFLVVTRDGGRTWELQGDGETAAELKRALEIREETA
jgi:hypothetical protein